MPRLPILTPFVTTACLLAVVVARRLGARAAAPAAGRLDTAETGPGVPRSSLELPGTIEIAGTTVAADQLLSAVALAPVRPSRPYASAAGAALRLVPGWGDPRTANRLGAVAERLSVTPQALARMSLAEAQPLADLLCELDATSITSNGRPYAVLPPAQAYSDGAQGRQSMVLAAAS